MPTFSGTTMPQPMMQPTAKKAAHLLHPLLFLVWSLFVSHTRKHLFLLLPTTHPIYLNPISPFLCFITEEMGIYTQTPIQALSKAGPHQTHTPQKEMDPVGSSLIPPTRREGELEVRSSPGPFRPLRSLRIWLVVLELAT